jgi:antitoxin VapB
MPVRIKNPEVERLVAETCRLTGENKTEAVRRALEERKTRLGFRVADAGRMSRLERFLVREVWPLVPPAQRGRALTTKEEETLLGYGPEEV